MTVQALGYVGLWSSELADWAEYGVRFLGLQLAERAGSEVVFRMDDRRQRLVVSEDADEAAFFGWEVADAAALDRAAGRLEAAGVEVARGDAALASRRHVAGLVCFADPLGNRVELFYGADAADAPFRPGRCISGFRTGPLGLGHAVLTVPRIEAVLPFYRDFLGFRLSDWMERPFRAAFLHVNPRHHSLALLETGKAGLHHLMMELFHLDDVGQGYDLALAEPGRIATTLGRHTNDYMTSFYARTPGGRAMIEYGWGGRAIDPASWQPQELRFGGSLWGHDRQWLSPERQAEARALCIAAAAEGQRAPVQVLEGNYRLMAGECPWWDSALRSAAE